MERRNERAYKPGSVIGNHLSRLCVAAKLKHATRMHGRAAVSHSYLRLLQMGFTKLRCCQRTGALLPHRFSFSPANRGVSFSVALSVGFPRPAVSWHLALRSPDFPHACARDCPAHSDEYYTLFHTILTESTRQRNHAFAEAVPASGLTPWSCPMRRITMPTASIIPLCNNSR